MTLFSSLDPLFLKSYKKNWGWFFVWGIILVILGISALIHTIPATLISVIVLGFLILMAGVIVIIDALTFWWHRWKGFIFHILIGILYCALGLVLIKTPLISSMTLTFILGFFYLIIGLFRILYSISLKTPQWGWALCSGLIAFILGVLIIANLPFSGLYIIGLFIGIDLIFYGFSYLIGAISTRSITK